MSNGTQPPADSGNQNAPQLTQRASDWVKTRQVLKTLQDADIVRQRLDPDQDGGVVWLLYHDYLCAGVLELDRRAREWQIVLEEAVRVFEGVQGLVGKWKALLSPALQLRLAVARLRGRLSFGKARRFVALSALRVVINVWVVLLLAGFYVWRDLEAERTAQDLFSHFTLEVEMSVEEAEALWTLSHVRDGVKEAFFEIIFKQPRNANRFLEKPDHILQATVGLNQGDRCYLLAEIVGKNCYRTPDVDFSRVCRHLLDELIRVSETADTLEIASNQIGELMTGAEDLDQFFSLLPDLGRLGEKLPSEVAAKAANRIIEVMAVIEVPRQLTLLSIGLAHLGEKLPSEVAAKAANRIGKLMAMTEDPDQLTYLSKGLGVLGEKLPPSEVATKAANRIVELMAVTKDSSRLYSLSGDLGSLGERLSSEDAAKFVNRIVELMAVTEHRYQLSSLSSGLSRLGENLTPESAQQFLQALLAIIHPLPEPQCDAAIQLIRKDNLQPIIELLKWPTCSVEDRNQLIEKIGQVTGQSFGEGSGFGFQPDMWTFIEWAEKEGYEPGRPPKVPELVRFLWN